MHIYQQINSPIASVFKNRAQINNKNTKNVFHRLQKIRDQRFGNLHRKY